MESESQASVHAYPPEIDPEAFEVRSVSRADVSNRRPIPVLTAVALATAAIDGAWTRLMGVAGFLTGIFQGILGEEISNREPTRMTKEEAFNALRERQANRPEHIHNDTPGAPAFFYCKVCGALAYIRLPAFPKSGPREIFPFRQPDFQPPAYPPDYFHPSDYLCPACCEMKKAGWLK